jgi:uncharacterized protein YrrD
MRVSGSQVIGLRVVTKNTGEEIDTVKDVLYSSHHHQIVGLLIKADGLFGQGQVILTEDIESIGPDAVIIKSKEALVPSDKLPEPVTNIIKSDHYLSQTRIMSEDGEDLGEVSDLHFDSQTGQVIDFTVSQGTIKNMESGQKTIKPAHIITVGKDATIVKTATKSDLASQAETGGLKGVLNQSRQSAKNQASSASGMIQQTVNDPTVSSRITQAKQNITQTNRQLRHEAGQAAASPRAQKAKTAARGVLYRAKAAVDEALDQAASWGQDQTAATKGGKTTRTTPKSPPHSTNRADTTKRSE